MPPSSRKRKEVPQATRTTLLNYFGSSPQVKKCKPSKPSCNKRAKGTQEAIIVIDSDEEAISTRRERVKSPDDSSDIEIIGFIDPKTVRRRRHLSKASSDIVENALNVIENLDVAEVASQRRSQTASPVIQKYDRATTTGGDSSENIFISSPPLLTSRRRSSNKSEAALPQTKLDIGASAFSSHLCVNPSTASNNSHTEPVFSASETKEVPAEAETDFSFDYGINWDLAMRDNEMDYLPQEDPQGMDELPDNIEAAAVSDGPHEGLTSGKEDVCPVCEKSFQGSFRSDFERHVNRCLDLTVDECPSVKAVKTEVKSEVGTTTNLASASSSKLGLSSITTALDNAFSFIMSSHTDNNVWKEADVVEDRTFKATKANGGRRKAPFYKVLQGMPISVDAFRYGTIPDVNAYFLTHAHSDHYTNLSSNWKSGPIYCSETTANLIVHMLSVDRKWVHGLPNDIPVEIPNTGGVRVTLIEANHCPGSSLFLFEGPQTVNAGDSTFKSSFVGSSRTFRYLHCGDFRACPEHVLHPAVRGKRLDHVYLDTTYLDPKYCFPPQPMVISACADLAKKLVAGEDVSAQSAQRIANGAASSLMRSWVTVDEKGKGKQKVESKLEGKTLVVIGTYSIGKERIVKAVAEALNSKIYCDPRKTAILRCEADPDLHEMLTSNPFDAGVHVVPLGQIASDHMATYMERWNGHWAKVVAFRPTGWTYVPPAGTDQSPSVQFVISRDQNRTFTYANLKPMKNSTPNLMCFDVPYSEHSSFFELTCFALSCDWGKIIATVNVGSESSRAKINKWIERWSAEKKRRRKDMLDGPDGIVKYRKTDYW